MTKESPIIHSYTPEIATHWKTLWSEHPSWCLSDPRIILRWLITRRLSWAPKSLLNSNVDFNLRTALQSPVDCPTICYHKLPELKYGIITLSGVVSGITPKITAANGSTVSQRAEKSSMVERLQAIENVSMLFFFPYVIAANWKPRTVIQDWLAQLFTLVSKWSSSGGCTFGRPTGLYIWCHFVGIVDRRSSFREKGLVCFRWNVWVGVENACDFLQRFNNLVAFGPSSVKLMMASRPSSRSPFLNR